MFKKIEGIREGTCLDPNIFFERDFGFGDESLAAGRKRDGETRSADWKKEDQFEG